MIRKLITLAALAAALATVPVAAAHDGGEPTCSDAAFLGVDVHGQHVVRDYVAGDATLAWPPEGGVGSSTGGEGAAVPGGPGPGFHFPNGVAPGASFCNSQSQSPGFHLP